ncbi:MAG: TIGR04282 family arsenosugar biosynthesis glycosyltransferase [Pseudomonadota bacterium]
MTNPLPSPDVRVVAFARFPVAGMCKTRLIPAVGADGAAAVHTRLVETCVTAMRGSGLSIELWTTGAEAGAFRQWLGTDIAFVDQGHGDLGDRLARAAAPYPVIFIGSDAPDLDAERLIAAAAALRSAPAVIGPAEDGGYYLLGLNAPAPWLFNDMEWGTETVFTETMRRFSEHGIVPAVLEMLADVDRPEDLARWPELTQ